MSKELEALNRIFNGMSNNVGYIKYFELIRHALTELEKLKRDVKRFIELLMKDNPTGRDTFDIEILKDKLLKVGTE